MNLEPEEIVKNFDTFRTLCGKVGDRADAVLTMVDALGENLALAPASSRTSFHNCMSGGLVEHSLRVLQFARTNVKAHGWEIDKQSLILTCLMHDIGKVGLPDENGKIVDFYVPNDSDWHVKRGEVYKLNEKLPFMTTQHRSLFLLQSYGIRLTRDEYLAIMLNDGFVTVENKPYCLKEPLLAHAVMMSDYQATMVEKDGWQ